MADVAMSPSDLDGVYGPLARRLGAEYLALPPPPVPVVAITGGVAVGKSTTARSLQGALQALPDAPRVSVVSTDGFLFTNRELAARGLSMHKGFPETYDTTALASFLTSVRAGEPELRAPIYSHEINDVVAGEFQRVERPSLLLLEGLGVMQPDVAPLVDFVIYVDADEHDMREWYVERFLAMFPASLLDLAMEAWEQINLVNLHEHIVPMRDRADLVLEKGRDHAVRRMVERTDPRDTMIRHE